MQELTTEKRVTLCKGLDYLIQVKEFEIKQIRERTEEDYVIKEEIIKIAKGHFSLEEAIMDDVYRVKKEIDEIKEMKREIDNGRNRILFVPTYIRLHLTAEQ